MPTSDEQIESIRTQLGKYIKSPSQVHWALQSILSGEADPGQLEQLGVPKAGISGLLKAGKDIQGVQARESEAAEKEAGKEWDDLTTSPEEEAAAAAAGAGGAPDFSGFTDQDWAAVQQDIAKLGQPAPEAAPAATDPDEERFGNDMAWLDDAFKQKEITTADALKFGTSADPEQEARQKQAINELFDLYQQGGMTAQDRAARAKNRAETENLMAGQSAATMQDMAERGMSGSGAELAAMLANQQGAAGRLSQADLQTSADSEARALGALMGGQQAASSLGSQQNQFVQNNADLMRQAASSNADWLRKGYSAMIGSRNDWDLQTLLAKIGVATGQQEQDIKEQETGYGIGTDVAKHDSAGYNAGQGASNEATQGAYLGLTPGVQDATGTRIAKTGGTQAAAGRSASGGAEFVGNIVTSLYGGKGGGGGTKTETKKTG